MNADGSNERALTVSVGRDENPVWSPEGEYIAFQTERDGNFEVYFMDVGGTFVRRLTFDPAGYYWPTWTSR